MMMQKLKNLMLEPKHQTPSGPGATRDASRRSRRASNSRRGDRRTRRNAPPETEKQNENYKAAWWVLAVLAPFILFILFSGDRPAIPINPETLCPIENEHVVRKTYILVDLSEPLSQTQRSSLQNLLETAAENMHTREFLSISQMQAVQNAPREEVQRFCSPDIQRIGQAGKRITTKDCGDIIANDGKSFDWPRNLGETTRESIHKACEDYLLLKNKVVEASERYKNINLEQPYSYIVGSIEDVMEAANDEPSNIPARLIVFSDMLQNADWFSQYRKSHGDWTIENLRKRRGNAATMGAQPDNNFDEVLLCYLPSKHRVLANSRNKGLHREMWEDYFAKSPRIEYEDASGCAEEAKKLMRKSI